jgi:hypothetical protein
MPPHDPYARLAAPRRPAGDADTRPGRAVFTLALVLALLAVVAAIVLPLGPRRGIDKLLRAPSAAVTEDR